MKKLLIALAVISIQSCGGGGGGASSEPFYGGVWEFVGVQTVNNCGFSLDLFNAEPVTVNQQDKDIVAEYVNNTYEGKVIENDGFLATRTFNAENCPCSASIAFLGASDGKAESSIIATCRCGGILCSTGYSGTATRK